MGSALLRETEKPPLAGLSRADFLDELYRRKAPACPVTTEELVDKIQGD